MQEDTAALPRQSQDLYQRFVKPLEQDHEGQYVAVSDDGQIVLAPTLLELMDKAEKEIHYVNSRIQSEITFFAKRTRIRPLPELLEGPGERSFSLRPLREKGRG